MDHPAPLYFPTGERQAGLLRGELLPHPMPTPSFRFPPSSPCSSPLIIWQRLLGKRALFKGISEYTSLSSNEQAISFQLFSSPAEQSCISKEKQSQVLSAEQREGPRGLIRNTERLIPRHRSHRQRRRCGGTWQTKPKAKPDSRDRAAVSFWVPWPRERRGAIEFCSTTPCSLYLSLDFPRY